MGISYGNSTSMLTNANMNSIENELISDERKDFLGMLN
jgi:hypothetical protein